LNENKPKPLKAGTPPNLQESILIVEKVDSGILPDLHVFTPTPNYKKIMFGMLFVGMDEDLTTT
jgi:hypothetical protein